MTCVGFSTTVIYVYLPNQKCVSRKHPVGCLVEPIAPPRLNTPPRGINYTGRDGEKQIQNDSGSAIKVIISSSNINSNSSNE